MTTFAAAQKAYDNACDPRLEDNSGDYAPCDMCGDFCEHENLTAKWILDEDVICHKCKE